MNARAQERSRFGNINHSISRIIEGYVEWFCDEIAGFALDRQRGIRHRRGGIGSPKYVHHDRISHPPVRAGVIRVRVFLIVKAAVC